MSLPILERERIIPHWANHWKKSVEFIDTIEQKPTNQSKHWSPDFSRPVVYCASLFWVLFVFYKHTYIIIIIIILSTNPET